MSYVRSSDEDDDVQLGQFRQRLEHKVSARTRVDFSILADRADAAWADHWRHRVEETLDADTMLLVIVTPDLFGSAACREEIARFREREKKLGRDDLIVAVYYASTPAMDNRIPRRGDEMARLLRSRRYADWRTLRFEPMTSPAAVDAIGQLANALVIDKPLEIIGDGRAEDIVIRVRDNHVVTLRASSGRIANLTLRQDGGDETWWNGVFVVQGELGIDGCDISCPGPSCVAITKGATGRVRRSTIHHAKSMGVLVIAERWKTTTSTTTVRPA